MLRQVFGVVCVSSFLAAAPLGVAGAADMNMPLKAPPAPPAPAYVWTGCYIDAGGGYGLWTQDHTTSTTFAGVPGTTISQTDGGNGWLGRFGGGCDYQVAPRWVIGAFGDYDIMSLTGTNSPLEVIGLGAGGGAPFDPVSATEKESGAWNVGARVGYLLTPGLLTYANVGFTQAKFDSQSLTTNLGVPIGFGYSSQTYNGFFTGAGTEASLADWLPGLPTGLFLRSEYRFSDYERRDINEITLATGVPDGNVQHTRPYVQTIVTSLVWRFNWTGH